VQPILNILATVIFAFLSIQVGYLLFFAIMGKIVAPKSHPTAAKTNFIRLLIPGYKEDAVIIATAKSAISHNYPKDKFEVVVIADSFSNATLQTLRTLPIKIVEVQFEKSTKGKALQKAIAATADTPADIVLVLDADNHMAPGFLHAINNAFENGYAVIQGHRTAKNTQNAFALLDACTEEINNHIFRRGHVAAGLPSALIGSGMAFSWPLFTSLLQNIGDTSGEDKELEFRIVRQQLKVAFLDGCYVYDEKVSGNEVFSKQRSRWLATQVEFFQKYFIEGWVQLAKGNIAFFNKVFQTYLLPRVMLVAATGLWLMISFWWMPQWFIGSMALMAALCTSLLLGIPGRWYNSQLWKAFLQIPGAVIGMLQALLQIGKARKQFIHTPHGEAAQKH
jgi:cellulose synthase/poly-beta-1,6-N-acetylglucosamine synthase-like glycosyltransferase